jgi:hypothetical protein
VGRVIETYFVFAGQSGNSAGAAEHLFVSSISPMNKANLVFGSFQLVLAEPVLQKGSLLARMFGVVDVYNKEKWSLHSFLTTALQQADVAGNILLFFYKKKRKQTKK